MKINVSGSKSKLQSSLDFYLKITSLQEYKSLDDMRKKMFNTFIREENARSDLNELYNTDGIFEEAITTELDIENEILETENINLENEKEKIEKEEIILEPEKKHLDNESIVYVSHGRFVDSVEVKDTKVMKEVTNTEEDYEFVNHGRYMEDFVVKEDLEYVEHGRYVEDYAKRGSGDLEGLNTSTDDLAEVYDDTEDVFVEETDLNGSDDVISVDEGVIDINDISFEENITIEEVNVPKEVNTPRDDFFEETSEEDLSEIKSVDEFFEDMIAEEEEVVLEKPKELNIKDIVLEDAEDPNKRVTKEDVLLKPSNIRDFIRQNGRSVEESLALKYYSKKEINDALRKTKIYKKNGKLYI